MATSDRDEVPAGFEPLFRTSPFLEEPPLTLTTAHISVDFAGSARIGDWVESRADVPRIGGRLAFVNVYVVVNSTRIVRASGVYLRGDSDAGRR